MQYSVYAIKDINSGLFDGLFLFTCDKHAQHEISQRVDSKRRVYTRLYHVGFFDITTGVIEPSALPTEIPFVDVDTEANVNKMSRPLPVSSEPVEKQVVDFVNRTQDIGV